LIIVGFDLATSSGWCMGRPQDIPAVGAVRPPASGKDYGVFGDFYLAFFELMLSRAVSDAKLGEPIRLVYEAPILPRPKLETDARGRPALKIMTTIQTTRRLGALGVLLETACTRLQRRSREQLDVEVRECQIQAIKNELAGHTRADKGEMVYAARRAGIALPAGAEAMDAADAFGAWLIGVRKWAPEHRAFWDRKLLAPMGQERMSAEEARGLFGRR
jgi:hypothetical protein